MDQENKLYQLTCLFSPNIAGEKLNRLVEKIKDGITSKGGSLSSDIPSANPIKKTLAYPIKKCQEAFYFSLNFLLPVQAISDLNKQLESENNIIRHLITNRAPARSPQAQIKSKKKQKEPLDFKIVDKIEPLPNEQTIFDQPVLKTDQTPREKTRTVPDRKEKKEKVKIEELDKKLEEILNQ